MFNGRTEGSNDRPLGAKPKGSLPLLSEGAPEGIEELFI
jgi:hypothetical protein